MLHIKIRTLNLNDKANALHVFHKNDKYPCFILILQFCSAVTEEFPCQQYPSREPSAAQLCQILEAAQEFQGCHDTVRRCGYFFLHETKFVVSTLNQKVMSLKTVLPHSGFPCITQTAMVANCNRRGISQRCIIFLVLHKTIPMFHLEIRRRCPLLISMG